MEQDFKFSSAVILLPLTFVLVIWGVFWASLRFNLDFTWVGILPRTVEGLPGILGSWLVHGNAEHLYNNSLPLMLMLAALAFFYRQFVFNVIVFGILLSGIFTWLFGRESWHIGASGFIYALVSFIFFKGLLTRYYRLVALSLLTVFLYGSMVWYVFPGIEESVSWEGHLGGLLAGLLMALAYQSSAYQKPAVYDWERIDFDPSQDKFMQRFDEHGHFIDSPAPDSHTFNDQGAQIIYHFKEENPSQDS